MKNFRQFTISQLDEAKTGKLSEAEFDDAIIKKMAELSGSKMGYKMTPAEVKMIIKRSPTMKKQFGALRTEMLKALNAKRDELQKSKGVNESLQLDEASKPKGNYYTIGGDRYDGGVVIDVFVNGKKVDGQLLDGEQDFAFKGKKFNHINKYLDAVGKANGVKGKDFKRIQESITLEEAAPQMKTKVSDFITKFIKELNAAKTAVKKAQGNGNTLIDASVMKALDKNANAITSELMKLGRGF